VPRRQIWQVVLVTLVAFAFSAAIAPALIESTKGTTFYAVSRSMQMKFMRLPKPQVKIGATLPERYR